MKIYLYDDRQFLEGRQPRMLRRYIYA